MDKRLSFYATSLETSVADNVLYVEVSTRDAELILGEFSAREIVDGYDNLQELYDLLVLEFNQI